MAARSEAIGAGPHLLKLVCDQRNNREACDILALHSGRNCHGICAEDSLHSELPQSLPSLTGEQAVGHHNMNLFDTGCGQPFARR